MNPNLLDKLSYEMSVSQKVSEIHMCFTDIKKCQRRESCFLWLPQKHFSALRTLVR